MRRILVCAIVMLFGLSVGSQDASALSRGKKTCLIINSYHEDELWASKMSKPVELYLAKNDSIHSEQVYLNNSSIKDMESYETVCNNIFTKYADKHPSYVVLVGNFAFTLRDRIKKEWGDIPFLLISRLETYAPTEQYFAHHGNEVDFNAIEQIPLGQVRDKYNFTAIIVPDYYKANIDLMKALLPNMKQFVFMSDKAYVNKIAAMNLQSLLLEMYPDMKFRWVQASEENREEMINYLIKRHPDDGLLISSWVYEINNTRGQEVLTTKDLSFLSGAVNPVFTMRQIYMDMGAIGGAFANNVIINDNITNMMEAMVTGKDLTKIPFAVPNEPLVSVNYDLMKKYDLNLSALPKGTVLTNRPKTYFEKYGWLTATIFLIMVIILIVILWRNKIQRKQIQVLERHNGFINSLPMPYTKSSLWLDKNDKVINISYEVKNGAYEELIEKNSLPDNPLHLFSNAYLSDIAQKIIATSAPVNVRYHFKRTDLYWLFIFVPIKESLEAVKKRRKEADETGGGAKLEVDVFAIDITKDHAMQQQLKDQAVTIDISMEMAKLVPWQWDVETDIISFYTYNSSDENNLGDKDRKMVTSMKFEDFIKFLSPADADTMMKTYNKILRGEISRLDMEYRRYVDKEKTKFEWCENHGVVTDTDSDGRPLRMTGSVQYITERKEQEEQMQEALTKARESDMLKSAFLANMSHEIRTPLNAIVGFSNLLTTTDDLSERHEFADIINRNNELLLSLINDILDLAKIESNTVTLTYDLCDIHDIVSSIAKTISIRVPKGVKLNVAHYADSCVVRADASHVSQVLINLLTNATKFTKRGSITVGYEIFEDENKLYFYVKDTGIGIKKENIDKVFNRFVKLNSFVQGSGLGLAICRTLIEKMGGEIGVESAGEGRGSMFWFTIPYDPMDLKVESQNAVEDVVHEAVPKDHIVGDRPERPAKVENQKNFAFKTPADISQNVLSALPDGLKVLVAEDNPSNYWLISRLMQDKFELFHAENGRIALDMLEDVNPGIIVMDINMPELDGYGAVEEMRKRGYDGPIIAVTAYAFASDRVRILSSGFDGFVSKPVSASILYDTIVEVWDRRKTQFENKKHQEQQKSESEE